MEITDKVRVSRPSNRNSNHHSMESDKVMVRASSVNGAKWKVLNVAECEDEGWHFVGLHAEGTNHDYNNTDVGMQILIEDMPVIIKVMQQVYEKAVIKEHKRKWSNNNIEREAEELAARFPHMKNILKENNND